METRPFLLHALSPLHAGTGQSVDIIDLPIARMRATGIPFVPGSSIKGVLRDACHTKRPEVEDAIFGPRRADDGPKGDRTGEASGAIDYSGALMVGDARLLALPVRSFRGTFALATSPLLLHLASRDIPGAPKLPTGGTGRWARAASDLNVLENKVYLEDIDLPAKVDGSVVQWAEFIAKALPEDEHPLLTQRLLCVDDETMAFLWETATQVDTRVRIDSTKGTVADGALWTEESLPAETLLVGVMAAQPSMKRGCSLTGKQVLEAALQGVRALQFGGKATIGRGRCHLLTFTSLGAA